MAQKKEVAQTSTEKPKRKPYQIPDLEPGDNTRYINHSLEIMKWPKPNMDSLEAVQQRCIDYFTLCGKNDMKPTFAGFALAFGIDRRTMWKWCNDTPDGRHLDPTIRDTIKKARDFINAQMEDFMQNGKINPVAGIFLMKNNMNYTDQQEVILKPDSPLGEAASAEDLRKKYLEDVRGSGATIVDAEKAE
nr:MAG TPA: Terminase small subunit [Bacteriophage sp.]